MPKYTGSHVDSALASPPESPGFEFRPWGRVKPTAFKNGRDLSFTKRLELHVKVKHLSDMARKVPSHYKRGHDKEPYLLRSGHHVLAKMCATSPAIGGISLCFISFVSM